MMKTVLSFVFCVLISVLSASDIGRAWYPNTWYGFQPMARSEVRDGVLHIFQADAKYGFGWLGSSLVPAVSGDDIAITATFKGRGKLTFQLQGYGNQGKTWTGFMHSTGQVQLTEDWQTATFHLLVGNLPKAKTELVKPCFSAGKGSELYIRDIQVKCMPGKYPGDFIFPRQWKLFADADTRLNPSLEAIPSMIGSVKPRNVTLNNGHLSLKPYFAKQRSGNCAWLYATLESPYDCDYAIGAGADYFMTFYVNGKPVIDTMKSGNGDFPPHFSNHIRVARLCKGTNILAMKFHSGGYHDPCLSLGGANELRNLAEVLTVTEKFLVDHYDKAGSRIGNPRLIQDIMTDGIEDKCSFGAYPANAEISFGDRKYQLPARTSQHFFVTGLRLQKLIGDGTMAFRLGQDFSLVFQQRSGMQDIQIRLQQKDKVINGMFFPKSALPTDIVLGLSRNEYLINLISIQDSRLRAVGGRYDFSGMGDFASSVKLTGCSAVVDTYFTGMGKREVKSNTVPFKIGLEEEFDPVKAGWKMVWQDEFNGDKVDWENNWMNTPWNPEAINREQATLKDGLLHIRCDFKKSDDPKRPFKGKTVGLYSRKRFGYGYYEARLRFTKKPGWWAAFWMFDEGRNMTVGGGYELDIFEDYSTRRGEPVVANNLHVTYGPNMKSYGYHFNLPGTLDDFYVIGCKWTPFEFSTYINGKLIKTSARHSPYASCTYDAFNHGFGVTKLYLCISGQAGSSGGLAKEEGSEEYLVDYVRAYEYPRSRDPEIEFTATPVKSMVKTGEPFRFQVQPRPSSVTGKKISAVYLFDNGNLIEYKTAPPYDFKLAIDRKHYENTPWDAAGRSGNKATYDSYPHMFRAVAQDEDGMVAYTDFFPVIVDAAVGKPYQGKIPEIPGSIHPGNYNEGGQNVAYYKQKVQGFPTGTEKLFNRRYMHLRESGEWANYSVNARKTGKYSMTLVRREYRRDDWPMRALVLVDGKYIGDLRAPAKTVQAELRNISLTAGEHVITVMSACTYGVWPEKFIFRLQD